jgi:hypothetical protein
VVEYSCLGDWFVGKDHFFAVANTKESRKDEKVGDHFFQHFLSVQNFTPIFPQKVFKKFTINLVRNDFAKVQSRN